MTARGVAKRLLLTHQGQGRFAIGDQNADLNKPKNLAAASQGGVTVVRPLDDKLKPIATHNKGKTFDYLFHGGGITARAVPQSPRVAVKRERKPIDRKTGLRRKLRTLQTKPKEPSDHMKLVVEVDE